MVGSMRPRLPPYRVGDTQSILSLDGGGVRGMIPATILVFVEEKLNELDPRANGNARIADYFDLIAGTSTGGILAALLATPTPTPVNHARSLRSAHEIQSLYLNLAQQIFPQSSTSNKRTTSVSLVNELQQQQKKKWWNRCLINLGMKTINAFLNLIFLGRFYDGKALRRIAEKEFQDKHMSETATAILLTAFDIRRRRYTIFSTYKGSTRDVLVKDACIATSAAPVYLPPHHFREGKVEYNAIDGGIVANNPTTTALIAHIYRDYTSRKTTIQDLVSNNIDSSSNFLTEGLPKSKKAQHCLPVQLLSLGCGEGKRSSYSAEGKWPILNWLFNFETGEVPLLNFFMEACHDEENVHAQILLQFLNGSSYPNGFLRIQEYQLPEKNQRMDLGTEENMHELQHIGEKLMNENVKIVNPITGENEDVDFDGKVLKNSQALEEFARSLVGERNRRLDRANSTM